MRKLPVTAANILDSDGKHPELRKNATQEQRDNAAELASRANALFLELGMAERPEITDGLRPKNAKYGAKRIAHKEGRAVDFADVGHKLSRKCTADVLKRHKMRREDDDFTPSWCHLDTREPHGVIFKP